MGKFIGGRIVPKHCGVWDETMEYEVLSIVLEEGTRDSYISRKAVPAGTGLQQSDYWAMCSRFSEQMKLLEDSVAASVNVMHKDVENTKSVMSEELAETENRVTEQVNAAEKSMQQTEAAMNEAVEQMNTRLDANVSASTEADADYAAEVVDARVDNNGQVYNSLGASIRGQIDFLSEKIDDVNNSVIGGNLAVYETVDLYVNGNVLTSAYSEGIKSIWFDVGDAEEYTISTSGSHNRFRLYGLNSKELKSPATQLIKVDGALTGYSYVYKNEQTYKYLLLQVCSDGRLPDEISICESNDIIIRGVRVLSKNSTVDGDMICKQSVDVSKVNFIRGMNLFEGQFTTLCGSSGKITSIDSSKCRTVCLSIEDGEKYYITVNGKHNRFYVYLSNTLIEGDEATLFINYGSSSRQKSACIMENTENYKYMLVTLAYDSEDVTKVFDASISITTDEHITVCGSPILTETDVRQLLGQVFYTTVEDLDSTVDSSDKLYSLYDELVSQYSEYVTMNVLGQNSLGADINEYVFSSGDFNSQQTQRAMDSLVKKPTVLILSGVHGNERSAVIATFKFFKDLVKYNRSLSRLRENLIFKVIPIVSPYAFDNNQRKNENDVNINRNFTTNWRSIEGSADNSGQEPADQKETQLVEQWLRDNNEAELLIDHHNSGYINEVSYLAGNNATEGITALKMKFLEGIAPMKSHFVDERGLPTDLVYAYTGNFNSLACSTNQGDSLGIPSVCLETSWNQGQTGLHSTTTNAVGAEVLGNMLLALFNGEI